MPMKTLLVTLSDPAIRRLLVGALPVNAWCVWHAVSDEGSWLPAAVAAVVTVAALAELWPESRPADPVQADHGPMRPAVPSSGERLLWRGIRAMRMPNAARARPLRDVPRLEPVGREHSRAGRERQAADAD